MFSLVFYTRCCVLAVCAYMVMYVCVYTYVILVIAYKERISFPLQADVASSFLQQIYYCFALFLVTIAASISIIITTFILHMYTAKPMLG